MVPLARTLFLLFCTLGIAAAQSTAVALTGTVITPDGIVPNGTVLIQNGVITAVGGQVTLPAGTKTVATGGVIAPGLIDLHNHLAWNVLPRWKPPVEYGTRYDWQQKPVYSLLMKEPYEALVRAGLECQMERYGEVKAIVEGETSVVGGAMAACDRGLARNLDFDPELGAGLGKIVYDIFPLTMSEHTLAGVNAALGDKPRGSLLIHVGEGSPNNASAAQEFYEVEARGLLQPGVSFIHGDALTPGNFAAMAKAGVGLIWSLRSNIELYGETTNVAAAKAAKVTIALAPDWSLTGSDGMLSELNYASTWNLAQPVFSDSELVTMATANAATLVGLQDRIGSVAANHAADLLVLRDAGKAAGKDANWTVTHAGPEDVALVMIGGVATYGDPQWMKQLAAGPTETLHVCGTEKLVSFATETQPQGSFAATEKALDQALRGQGRRLAPLAECGE